MPRAGRLRGSKPQLPPLDVAWRKVRRGGAAHQEIVGLHITMNEALGVHIFESAEKLVGHHEYCFELEPPPAIVEEVFEGRPKQVKNHDIVVAFNAVPPDIWNPHYTRRQNRGVWEKGGGG